MSSEPLPNIHPGDVLLNEFLKPMGVSQNKLARAMEVSPRRVNEIVNGKRSITANSALRLAKTLGTAEKFWMGLQNDYDLEESYLESKQAISHLSLIAA